MNYDQTKLDALMGTMIGHMTGATVCMAIWLGEELGLYRALASGEPRSADGLAHATGCHPRLVREWLDGQAAAGLVSYASDRDAYTLTPEAFPVLCDQTAPVYLARAMNVVASMYLDLTKVATAFRGDGKMSWGDHHPCLFSGTEWFFRTGYRAFLASTWIPMLEGVEAKLKAGARVADVGCGHGASVVVMADAYPESHFHGFDFHAPSIATARERAAEAGVVARTSFEVASATNYEGAYDLICFFDCLHDMGDPVGAARHARQHLAPGGSVLLVEPFALDGRAHNQADNPLAALLYNASSCICTPNSLSQDVGLGLGAQAGEARLRDVFVQAGFTKFTRVTETPTNLIFQARAS